MIRRLVLLPVLFLAGIFLPLQAQQLPDVQNPPRLVNDFADVLSPEEEQALEEKLLRYEDSTSTQVAIVLVKSLEGYDVADYSVRLALKWKIGTQKDNGVLVFAAMEDRKTRIEVGYGLEGALTDLTTKRILDEDVKPNFKQGAYYQGLDQATTHLFQAAKGEYKADAPPKRNVKKKKGIGLGLIIVIVVFVLLLIFRNRGGNRGGRGGGDWGDFMTGMLLGQMLSGGRRGGGGGWGDFSSGSGSFGGFGGGSFGGGGSSGDW